MPSTGSGWSCIMARKECRKSRKARNGCMTKSERLEEDEVGDTFSDWSQRNIHDCYPAVAWRVNGRGFGTSLRLGGLQR